MSVARLPDGRSLGYAQTGHRAGPPVFYFHGWPASRLEAALIEGLPHRLIAVDRPGYGLSSPQPRRRLLDWPADVAALADGLGIGAFHVVGVSGGAPFALACAAMLDRVLGAALISGMPPFLGPHAPPPDALGPGLQRLLQFGRNPLLGRAVMSGARLAMQRGAVDLDAVLSAGFCPADVACMTPALRRGLTDSWREGIRPGVAGALSDARIYAAPWGFDIAAVRAPVTVWHGTADRVVPCQTVTGYAALASPPRLLNGEGHYSLAFNHAAAILATLTGV